MSYQIRHPAAYVTGLAPSVQPHHYPLLPLAAEPTALSTGIDERTKKLLIAAVVVVAIIAVLWFANRKPPKRRVTRNPVVRKMSTADLAKNLYERLERRGNANETVMRSLKSYASQK